MNEEQRTLYLTAEGYRRLRQRLADYTAQLQRIESPPPIDEAQDPADAAEHLISEDDDARLGDLISSLEDTLRRARPLPSSPDDGVIRHGSAVVVQDADGSRHRFLLLDGMELESNPEEIALDSPLGQGLLGRRTGEQISVPLPHGARSVTIVSLEPYQAPAS